MTTIQQINRLKEIGNWLLGKENVHDANDLYCIANALAAQAVASGEYPDALRSALEQIRDAGPPEGGLMRGVDIWQAAFEELQRYADEALASHDGGRP